MVCRRTVSTRNWFLGWCLEGIKRLVISYGMPWWQQIKSLKSRHVLWGSAPRLNLSNTRDAFQVLPEAKCFSSCLQLFLKRKKKSTVQSIMFWQASLIIWSQEFIIIGEKKPTQNLKVLCFKNTFYFNVGFLWCILSHVLKEFYRHTCRLPAWLSGKESSCQCRRHRRLGFSSWLGKIPWRRKWQRTPVFLLGESHGQRSLVGCSLWGHKGLDTTENTRI